MIINGKVYSVNNHVKIHQSAIQKYTTLETAKIQKACYIIAVSRRPQNGILFSGHGGILLDGYLHLSRYTLRFSVIKC